MTPVEWAQPLLTSAINFRGLLQQSGYFGERDHFTSQQVLLLLDNAV